ncbi:MAG: LmbE family protein [Crocinitomicaceae bacterium]|nr:LmbE family protein [Crocinitomicaceae bacterium]|tara:strand:+ start:5910 stop:8417 length:2508 start_codon:yes stop_codon:yes gene_type:complete
MIKILFTNLICILSISLLASPKGGDKPGPASSAHILEEIEKLNVLGSVLYIAAHPDDENTRLISWLANDKKVRTGYLSLTRGGGGQNLIGSEKGELIGALRTQELLEARKIDGGTQFFSRAVDFGYSKTTDETLEKWNEDEVLWDMVWVIRKFKPEIIITRFPANKYAGHGHHSASAVLTNKAVEMAASPKVFPEQLKHVTAWRTKRLYYNTSSWWRKDLDKKYLTDDNLIRVDVGTYNATLGKWNNQIAMESRSQHKSQGFGASVNRGEQFEYLEYVSGDKAKQDLFDGIDLSWKRLAKTEQIQYQLDQILDKFDARNPSASVADLVELYRLMDNYQYVSYWMERKKEDLKNLIFDASGLWMEAVSEQEYTTPGGSIQVNTSIINAGNIPDIEIDSVSFPGKDTAIFGLLEQNKWQKVSVGITIPENASITQPYWLVEDYNTMFQVEDILLRGLPFNPPPYSVTYHVNIEGLSFKYSTPIQYKWRDRVSGENIKALSIRPELTINIDNSVYVCPYGNEQEIFVTVVNQKENMTGELKLNLPKGWGLSPASHVVTLNTKGSASVYTFKLKPTSSAQSGEFTAEIKSGNKTYNRSIETIEYPHIHTQTLFPKTRGKVVTGDIKLLSKKIGYISGTGDEVPEAIEQMGGQVEFLLPENLPSVDLKQYDVIVAGIRAYNTQKELAKYHQFMLDYVDSGGLYVIQYNTYHGMLVKDIGPYPIEFPKTRKNNRITNEFATTKFIEEDHLILNSPNKIELSDFDNWVQERGLYFPEKWDKNYDALLRWSDPNEQPLDGGIIVCDKGKGQFVYTGISFFRQLPAGVPGAYKLLANILSYGRE